MYLNATTARICNYIDASFKLLSVFGFKPKIWRHGRMKYSALFYIVNLPSNAILVLWTHYFPNETKANLTRAL